MKLPEIFPPADLIDRVKGVKRRLRQRPWLGATRVGQLPGGVDHPDRRGGGELTVRKGRARARVAYVTKVRWCLPVHAPLVASGSPMQGLKKGRRRT
jgi:hypothetical protein